MRRPSPAMLVALAALFIALGGAGMAATGGNFILGQSNSANNTSALDSGVTTGPALVVSNTGGKPAARLNTPSGVAPFVVNNTTKVQSLNADLLDGFDSGGFVRGRGTFLANRLVSAPSATRTLLTIPGLGYLQAICTSGTSSVNWVNDTGTNVNLWRNTYDKDFEATFLGPGNFAVVDLSSDVNGATLALGVGNDPNARRTAVLDVFALQASPAAPCTFQGHGTLWTSQ
jgi:hypothetical protein